MPESMLIFLRTALVLILSSASVAFAEPPEPPPGFHWELTLAEEFNGARLNRSKWGFVPDRKRRDGHWTRDAVTLDGAGHLLIETFERDGKYYTGGIRTKDKFEQTYGYYEARVKFPTQRGHWPTFWLTSESVLNINGDGKDGTEIDIIEKPRGGDTVEHGYVWDGYGEMSVLKFHEIEFPGISEGFHVAGLSWTDQQYTFYIDGQQTWQTNGEKGTSQVPEYIKLTSEIEAWTGDITQAQLPDRFVVDYVRAYQLKEGAAPETPQATNDPSEGSSAFKDSFEDGVDGWEVIWAEEMNSRSKDEDGVPVTAVTDGERALQVVTTTATSGEPQIWASHVSSFLIDNEILDLDMHIQSNAFPGADSATIVLRLVTGELEADQQTKIEKAFSIEPGIDAGRSYELHWDYAADPEYNWKADWAFLEILTKATNSNEDNLRLFLDNFTLTRSSESATPKPTDPAPTEPVSDEPSPIEPGPAEPSPIEPGPAEPSPIEPGPAEPTPAEPAPAEPAPAEPTPTEPAPAEPTPTEPSPADPAPAEPLVLPSRHPQG